jgi:hypothetical protein
MLAEEEKSKKRFDEMKFRGSQGTQIDESVWRRRGSRSAADPNWRDTEGEK